MMIECGDLNLMRLQHEKAVFPVGLAQHGLACGYEAFDTARYEAIACCVGFFEPK